MANPPTLDQAKMNDLISAAEIHPCSSPSNSSSPSPSIVVPTTSLSNGPSSSISNVAPTSISNRASPSPSTVAPTSTLTITRDPSFDGTFDEYFKNYLDAEPSALNDRDIRCFTQKIPLDYKVPEERYSILFDVLFKIKEKIKSKAVYNDSLFMVEKLFHNCDYNKFLVQFWNCDIFKERELGPIGYSFTDGKLRYDFNNVRPYDDVAAKNAKVVEAAWSMVLDVDVTVTALLNAHCNDKAMSVFYAIVLRRFKCLGDYKLKLDGKETPIFFYFFRRLFENARTTGHLISTLLSCMNTVTWTPKSVHYSWSLMKPNFALCEIMDYLLSDDANQAKYFQALNRLFNPYENFWCQIEWNSESKSFDNPSLFIIHFVKYFNRKNSIELNNDIFDIVACFKKSLRESGAKITNLDMLEENFEIDWPFAYCIFDFLDVQSFKRQISESIYKTLPENVSEKYVSLNEAETSLEKALIGCMELFFLCRSSVSIPDSFFKNLVPAYGSPKSVVDTFSKCIITAYKNLKTSLIIKVDVKLIEFISRICEYSLDSKVFQQFSNMIEIDADLIHRNLHLVIIGRIIRSTLEEIYFSESRKPLFTEMDAFILELFKNYALKIRNLFGEFRVTTKDHWPPWRKGAAPAMSDEISLAINHVLNTIQKEVFCIFDTTSGRNEAIYDLLMYLYKERRYFGFTFSRLEVILRNNYQEYFERIDAQDADRQQQYRNGSGSRGGRGGGSGNWQQQRNSQNYSAQNDPQQSQHQQQRYDENAHHSNQQQRYNNHQPSQNNRLSSQDYSSQQQQRYDDNRSPLPPPQEYQPRDNNDNRSMQQPLYDQNSSQGSRQPPEEYPAQRASSQQQYDDRRPPPPPQEPHGNNDNRSMQQPRYDQNSSQQQHHQRYNNQNDRSSSSYQQHQRRDQNGHHSNQQRRYDHQQPSQGNRQNY